MVKQFKKSKNKTSFNELKKLKSNIFNDLG